MWRVLQQWQVESMGAGGLMHQQVGGHHPPCFIQKLPLKCQSLPGTVLLLSTVLVNHTLELICQQQNRKFLLRMLMWITMAIHMAGHCLYWTLTHSASHAQALLAA
jgi:hypothetical protein